jgi:hypothetical protein
VFRSFAFRAVGFHSCACVDDDLPFAQAVLASFGCVHVVRLERNFLIVIFHDCHRCHLARCCLLWLLPLLLILCALPFLAIGKQSEIIHDKNEFLALLACGLINPFLLINARLDADLMPFENVFSERLAALSPNLALPKDGFLFISKADIYRNNKLCEDPYPGHESWLACEQSHRCPRLQIAIYPVANRFTIQA